jgi:exodeoxyribonuclease-5
MEEKEKYKEKKKKDKETGEMVVVDRELVKIEQKLHSYKKEALPFGLRLIILDEFSMVDDDMLQDLFSFGIPVLLIGDKKQLPPVGKKNSYMDEYEAELLEIMRQDKDSVLINAFDKINNLEALPYGVYGKKELIVLPDYLMDESEEGSDKLLLKVDQIICAKNATRKKINNRVRNILGINEVKNGYLPQVGDKVVCCKNQWDVQAWSPLLQQKVPLVNGTIGYVTAINFISYTQQRMSIDFVPNFDKECIFKELIISFENFDEKYVINSTKRDDGKFDFGYAITCHKSQGNQYNNVLVFAEKLFYDPKIKTFDIELEKKWLYTAASRAMKKLWIVIGPNYYNLRGYNFSDEYYNTFDEYYTDD